MNDTIEKKPAIRGRGTDSNPKNRFERLEIVADEEEIDDTPRQVKTQFFDDPAKSIISTNTSPDVAFGAYINPYRGCEHGCIYCYARPTHEYLGLSSGLDFETKIFVKKAAPELLRKELSTKSWKPQTICLSGATDAYQPIERKLELTRRCIEVLAEFRNPTAIITKNALVARDKDLLQSLAEVNAAKVYISVCTLDGKIARSMEPRTTRPDLRLAAMRELHEAGIPVGVLIGPVVPGLNDHEILPILEAAAQAGAGFAYYNVLRLPWEVKHLFEQWLEQHHPLKAKKVLHRIQDVRGGKLNDTNFGARMKGTGLYAEHIAKIFAVGTKKHSLNHGAGELSTAAFHRPAGDQLSLL